MSSSRNVYLVIGRLSANIGGPYQTLMSYKRTLESKGWAVRIVGLSPRDAAVPPEQESGVDVVRPGPQGWAEIIQWVWRSRRDPVIVFGVWHPIFFVFGLSRLVFRNTARLILVPTQSLSPWDWQKRARMKAIIRPLVEFTLARFSVVIFATHGEHQTSDPVIPVDKASVIYHPISPVTISSGPLTPDKVDAPVVVFVGRLAPQKDLALFIGTLAELPADWSAVVVGSGESSYVEGLKEWAKQLGVDTRISWRGWLQRAQVHEIVAESSVLLVTSHAENYCHASVEAMAIGTPVVMVDRVAAAVDVSRNGTGFVVAPSPDAIARVLIRVAKPSEETRQVIARARMFAEARSSGADGDLLDRVVCP